MGLWQGRPGGPGTSRRRAVRFGELLRFVTGKLPKNARGEWGLRQKDQGGALKDSNHWVVVRDGVVREDRRIQEGKLRHQARRRKDVV